MRKITLLLIGLFLSTGVIDAQSHWMKDKYDNFVFRKQLKSELNIVQKNNTDTVFAIWFNAAAHNSPKIFPHILWYHRGDTIHVFVIKPFCTVKYRVNDKYIPIETKDMANSDCSDSSKSGWDLLHVYDNGICYISTPVDQKCVLKSIPIKTIEKQLQHDISLLSKNIPEWIIW